MGSEYFQYNQFDSERHQRETGRIEVVTGSMFSGKSKETIRRAEVSARARRNVQAFKPRLDNRYGTDVIKSHNGDMFSAVEVGCSDEILSRLYGLTEVVVIDEGQFFDNKIIEVVKELRAQRIAVIINGLDMDFLGDPFGPMPDLMAIATQVDKLHAVCDCGKKASLPQRKINGVPARRSDPIILIGGSESYGPVCHECHKITED